MKMIRTVLERFSRGVVLKRKFRVGEKQIKLFVSPDAQLKYLKINSSGFDQDLVRVALEHVKPGNIVWDIGANVGTFTFSAASLAQSGAVLAVEADAWLVSLLRRTASLRDYQSADIKILSAAISNENSVSSFMIAARGRASNALSEAGGRSQMGGVRETHYVPTLTLDTLLNSFEEPDFVKIDIEGAELLALQAASKLINDVRPKFYIEVGENVGSQLHRIFKDAGYSCIDPISGNEIDSCVENTLFVPN